MAHTNAKTCKRIRKAVRDFGLDPKQARYSVAGVSQRIVHAGLNNDGTPKFKTIELHRLRLHPGCGRAAYRDMKRVARHARRVTA